MFGSEILDVAIGMIFVYLLLSLICSAVNEMIEARMKNRARDLEKGIRNLLTDKDLADELYKHPLIKGLYIDKKGKPSYIPARTFALTLLNIVAPADGATGITGNPVKSIRDAVATRSEVPDKIKQALLPLIDDAQGDLNRVRANVEDWYNGTMDRVSGWYKRRTHVIIFFVGLLITIIINADTITIGNSLSHDTSLRNSLVTAAQEYAKANPSPAPPPAPSPSSDIESCKRDANSPECRVETNLRQIQKLGLPVGWNLDDARTIPSYPEGTPNRFWRYFGSWLLKIIGWLLTAAAISLGAPFWFDLLNKFMVIRSTVKPHEKSLEEGSEDRQPANRPLPPPATTGTQTS